MSFIREGGERGEGVAKERCEKQIIQKRKYNKL